MSDSEDADVILDDIKALEAVLTEAKKSKIEKEVKSENETSVKPNLCEPSTSKTADIYPPTSETVEDSTAINPPLDIGESENERDSENLEDEEDEEDEEEEEDNNLNDLSDPEAALILNQKIIGLLSTAKKRLELLLKECKRRQDVIDQDIRQRTTDPLGRMLLTIAGIPYFKDRKQFPSPQNQDAKIKASRGELQIIDLPCPLRWTLKDRNTLWGAIYWNAKADLKTKRKNKLSEDEESSLNETEDPLRLDYKSRSRKIPEEMIRNIKQLVGPLGSREFDWMKIAATDFNGRHSASECRAMWNVFLHPDINKGKWKKAEDNNLKLFTEEYNFQNWDTVALRLGTNRSGYQCFIRFNTNFKNNMFSRITSWSKEEDQKLTDTVNTLRTGNFIPWGEVAKVMGNRRKQQIYVRWNYSLAPNLKKGRFTEEEDKLLLQGVAKFGPNFTKISVSLLPHRTTAQINDHYRTLMNEKKNDWSCEDDMKLVKLFDEFGNDWSSIAKEFSNKSRVQVRHRHTAIIRYLSKGLSIRTIPRWGEKKEEDTKHTPEEALTRGEQLLNDMSDMMRIQHKEKQPERREKVPKIDLELRDYFKAIYRSSSKPGRNRKFYTAEELDPKSRKLNIILNMLNADLQIPDNLEEEVSLTEKDKQLLNALKACSRDESPEIEARHKRIEYIRRKMFGSSMPSADEERFIPPLPFNGKAQRCKRRKLVGINYVPDGDKCLVELTREFYTPEIIVSLIGGWDSEIEFQNLEKIFIGRTSESIENSLSMNTGNEITLMNSLDFNTPSTSSGIVNNEVRNFGQGIVSNRSSQIIMKKQSKYYPEMIIPPNYVTLLGFRGILLSKHILEAKDFEVKEYQEKEEKFVMTPEGEKALELLEERLIKLFKFPIELSEIPPPLLHGSPNGEFDDIDEDNENDNCQKKKRKTNSASVARKKLKVEKIAVRKTSESQ